LLPFAEIVTHADVLNQATLNAQQRTFVDLMHKLAHKLQETLPPVVPLIDTHRLAPLYIRQEIDRAVMPIRGYAELLLRGGMGEGLEEAFIPHAQALADHAHTIQSWFNERVDTYSAYEKEVRQATPQAFDARVFLEAYTPAYSYWVAQKNGNIHVSPREKPLMIVGREFHIGQLIWHIVSTYLHEIATEPARLEFALAESEACGIFLIDCTTVPLTPDKMSVLFEKQGRYMYREQLDVEEGYLRTQHHPAGTTLQIYIPKLR
jgi:hypothetical protein